MRLKGVAFTMILLFSGQLFAEGKSCAMPNVEHGRIAQYYYTFKNHYFPMNLDKKLSFFCLAGYTSKTGKQEDITTCTSEGWSPKPECFKKCNKPDLNNGFFSDQKILYKIQETLHYRCDSGYKTTGGKDEEVLQCLANGWSSEPNCNKELEICLAPELYHGNYSTSQKMFRVKEKLHYTCDNGYLTTGGKRSEEAECHPYGWSFTPKCTRLTCSPLRAIENGYFNPTKKTYEEGDVVQFSCLENYYLSGSDLIQCYNFGWYPEPPLCEERRNRCPPPPLPPNAKIKTHPNTFRHGEIIHIECELNFELEGSEEIHCEHGKWTPPPNCIEIKEKIACEEPPMIMNGSANFHSKIYYNGDKVTYTCENGYHIKGSDEIICKKGKWTSPPKCMENNENCKTPPEIEHGTIVDELLPSYVTGSSVEYRCNIYYLLSGSPKTLCVQGKWSTPPICLEPCTVNVGYMHNNNIEMKWNFEGERYFLHGDNIDFICKQGYDLSSSTRPSELIVQCNRGQLKYPTCIRKESEGKCGSPPVIRNGNAIGSPQKSYENGSSVEYQCLDYHFLQGSKTAHCLQGQWTTPPMCLEPCTLSSTEMENNNLHLKWSFDNRPYFFHGEYIEFLCKRNSFLAASFTEFDLRVQCHRGQLKYPQCIERSRVMYEGTSEFR
ncbi:coagulation factor XIII B chain isoform X2 [Monodelphis domestica]|uniref:coagulation factor XIII B chain isoform X2 n=1 Tax=Monodelphis domestica TaxID=13616 RepID=UPI0024E26E5C|nr:coagulation factor XIII B chain isoform X2 [Monodelphis domestica]